MRFLTRLQRNEGPAFRGALTPSLVRHHSGALLDPVVMALLKMRCWLLTGALEASCLHRNVLWSPKFLLARSFGPTRATGQDCWGQD